MNKPDRIWIILAVVLVGMLVIVASMSQQPQPSAPAIPTQLYSIEDWMAFGHTRAEARELVRRHAQR